MVQRLASPYPGSVHVSAVGLARADDTAVWEYAARHGLTIVSKDADFHQLSFLRGAPPKVVWIRRGNCSTRDVEAILRGHSQDLIVFAASEDAAFLILD